jgi:hypothetical protein
LRLVAGGWFVLREKYCWLVADKPSEQADCCGCEKPGIKIWAALILKDSSALYAIFDFLSGFEEFMKK